ncbi:TerC family protein [Robbsia andropogonis]|uniref:TerC family protein n=1 Tax=Robbsia andropogonis TaxID=28092 RepID=UPI0012F89BE8|nr:hypothetical protein [Robbsia andropogonis]
MSHSLSLMNFPSQADAYHFAFAGVQWSLILQLLILDITLGLNNIVGIAPVCASIPRGQRRRVLVRACISAFLLRVTMLTAAQALTLVPHLSFFAGIYLCYLAYRLVVEHRPHREPVADSIPVIRPTRNQWRIAGTIAFVDASLSIDNVIALAAAIHALQGANMVLTPVFQDTIGSGASTLSVSIMGLLYAATAVAISIPLVLTSAVAIAPVLNRSRWLTWGGAVLLAWAGISVAVADSWFQETLRWIQRLHGH